MGPRIAIRGYNRRRGKVYFHYGLANYFDYCLWQVLPITPTAYLIKKMEMRIWMTEQNTLKKCRLNRGTVTEAGEENRYARMEKSPLSLSRNLSIIIRHTR